MSIDSQDDKSRSHESTTRSVGSCSVLWVSHLSLYVAFALSILATYEYFL